MRKSLVLIAVLAAAIAAGWFWKERGMPMQAPGEPAAVPAPNAAPNTTPDPAAENAASDAATDAETKAGMAADEIIQQQGAFLPSPAAPPAPASRQCPLPVGQTDPWP